MQARQVCREPLGREAARLGEVPQVGPVGASRPTGSAPRDAIQRRGADVQGTRSLRPVHVRVGHCCARSTGDVIGIRARHAGQGWPASDVFAKFLTNVLRMCKDLVMPRLTLLKRAILEAEITQRELAELLGIHETSFSSIVNGRLIPSEDRKRVIADALCRELDRDISLEELWPPEPERVVA